MQPRLCSERRPVCPHLTMWLCPPRSLLQGRWVFLCQWILQGAMHLPRRWYHGVPPFLLWTPWGVPCGGRYPEVPFRCSQEEWDLSCSWRPPLHHLWWLHLWPSEQLHLYAGKELYTSAFPSIFLRQYTEWKAIQGQNLRNKSCIYHSLPKHHFSLARKERHYPGKEIQMEILRVAMGEMLFVGSFNSK